MARPAGSVSYDNTDRIVLVTGGSSGIGRSVCELMQQSGAVVVSMDVQEISPPLADVHFRQGDTSDPDQCEQVVSDTVTRFGGLDVLVNCASIQPLESYRPMDELQREVWDRMVAINLSGYAWMAAAALRQMKGQGGGVVVNVASGQGHRTARQVPAYGPIKAANLMQTRQWGVEYARQGVRVVSVSPGAIETPLLMRSLGNQGGTDQVANRHPLGRIGQPEEVARAILWLASDHASFITATDLEIDGGLGAFAAFADPF